MMMQLAVERNN